jgi:hypothetical protein
MGMINRETVVALLEAEKISLSKAMVNALQKNTGINFKRMCDECGFLINSYRGAYPKTCTVCGGKIIKTESAGYMMFDGEDALGAFTINETLTIREFYEILVEAGFDAIAYIPDFQVDKLLLTKLNPWHKSGKIHSKKVGKEFEISFNTKDKDVDKLLRSKATKVRESISEAKLKQPYVVYDTADGNNVVGMASDEKGAKGIISSAELPPMSIKDKKTLKIIKTNKKQDAGYPLNEAKIDDFKKLKNVIIKSVSFTGKDKNDPDELEAMADIRDNSASYKDLIKTLKKDYNFDKKDFADLDKVVIDFQFSESKIDEASVSQYEKIVNAMKTVAFGLEDLNDNKQIMGLWKKADSLLDGIQRNEKHFRKNESIESIYKV